MRLGGVAALQPLCLLQSSHGNCHMEQSTRACRFTCVHADLHVLQAAITGIVLVGTSEVRLQTVHITGQS